MSAWYVVTAAGLAGPVSDGRRRSLSDPLGFPVVRGDDGEVADDDD